MLLLSEVGIFVGFVVVFVGVISAFSGATLLSISLVFPQTTDFSGFELPWLVVPASLASVLIFDLLDAVMSRSLRQRIRHELRFGLGEALGQGLSIALMLLMISRSVSQAAEVTIGAALAAGMISAFARYYIGLVLNDSGSTEAPLLLDEDSEDTRREE